MRGGVKMITYRVTSLQHSDDGPISRIYARLTLSAAVETIVRLSSSSRSIQLELASETRKGE
jgi:hypothetical protein